MIYLHFRPHWLH